MKEQLIDFKNTKTNNLQRERELAKQQKEIERLEEEIKMMCSSFSWRITFPFRVVRVSVQRLALYKNICLLKDNIKLEGGILNFLTVSYQHIRDFNVKSFFYGFSIKNIDFVIKYETWFKRYGLITAQQTKLLQKDIKKTEKSLKFLL